MDNKTVLNQIRGKRNKASGEIFESCIKAACEYYEQNGIAVIEKTPEPMRVLKSLGNGKFVSVFTSQAQPDFKGTLKHGKSIVFEAKYTDSDIIEQNRLTGEQFKRLEMHSSLGAYAFVLTSLKLNNFYFAPFAVWQGMRDLFGRKYMTMEELKPYRVPFTNGVIRFLDRFEL